MLAGRLDGVAQLDAATIDVDVRHGLDGIGDHLSGNGTEQLTLFAHLGFDLDERAVERFLDLAGVGKAVLFALGDVVLALLELLQVALRSEDGNLLREQVVVGKTGGHVHDVAFTALALQFLEQDDFHGSSLRLAAATVAATADGGHRVGHQSHLAGALHGVRDVALMLGAGTRHAARLDLSAIGNVLAQHLRVFVVDVLRVLFAELAELATRLLRVIGHF